MNVLLLILDLSLVLLSCLVFYQDLRERAVSVVLFAGSLLLAAIKYGLADVGYLPVLFNTLFIVVQVLVVILYCRFRYQSLNLFRFFGAGDLLCWLILSLLFSPINFIAFFVLSLLASFAMFLLLKKIQQNVGVLSIPLAGFQSLLLIFVLVFCRFYPKWQPYDDFSLLSFIGLV